MSEQWTQSDAIALCTEIERYAPNYGCHVALTGGCLYKSGSRKDLDILFYRIRQVSEIDHEELFAALDEHSAITVEGGFGWCVKATDKQGRKLDLFFPEEIGAANPGTSGSTEEEELILDQPAKDMGGV